MLSQRLLVSPFVKLAVGERSPDHGIRQASERRTADMKTHKTKLAVRPILSATGTYNYKLAKWLDEKLKPLSVNDQTINDIFSLADDLQGMKIDKQDILVS